jgi:hypothetical protein
MVGDLPSPGYSARPVHKVSSSQKKDYRLTVRFPEAAPDWELFVAMQAHTALQT